MKFLSYCFMHLFGLLPLVARGFCLIQRQIYDWKHYLLSNESLFWGISATGSTFAQAMAFRERSRSSALTDSAAFVAFLSAMFLTLFYVAAAKSPTGTVSNPDGFPLWLWEAMGAIVLINLVLGVVLTMRHKEFYDDANGASPGAPGQAEVKPIQTQGEAQP